jgi:hypothetical protein
MTKDLAIPLSIIEKLSADMEMVQVSLQLCSDSLHLHNVLDLYAVNFTVRELAGKTYEVLETLNKLQLQPVVEEVHA